ncbi:MAG: DMT family transporter [Chloroflexota bacterium]|nr:DMT family transporter [Dehalococcoidia bacterium]MDW8253407.1 DMT family transporter [Chloroflexota bacterium]
MTSGVHKYQSVLPVAALIAVTAIWGSTFVAIKGGLDGIAPFGFLVLRFGLAALCLLPFYGRDLRRMTAADWTAALVVGLWLFGAYALQMLGVERSTASKGGFITGLSVIFVPIGVWLWQHRAPGWRFAFAAALATLGLGLLTLKGDLTVETGDLLLLGCAVCFAGHIIALGHSTQRHPLPVLVVGQVGLVALLSLPFALAFERVPIPTTPAAVFGVVYTSLAATVFVLVVQTWAQRTVSPTRAAIIFAAEPVFAALFAVLLGGETLSALQVVGGALIVIGMLFAIPAEAKSTGVAGRLTPHARPAPTQS